MKRLLASFLAALLAVSPTWAASPTTPTAFTTSASFTSGTTAYAASDVAGGALEFPNICPPGGGFIQITSVAMRIDAAAVIAGATSYDLHLYSVTPPSALADSAAWDLPSGDRASYLGRFSLGTPLDVGATIYVNTESINKQVKCAGSTLYGYLVTIGAYTPLAQVYTVTLHTVSR